MKPIQLFTGMLAVATIVVTSCSAPRLAQQGTITDDVYNSTAQAKEYTPAPQVQGTQTQEPAYDDEYYGTNDPYYDMTYSSRINRFYYGSPWRNYYDPYFDYYAYGAYPWYGGLSMGWGSLYSPFWGMNSWGYGSGYPLGWGWNNWGWNSYYGGGFLGGGYYGGGFYTGRTTNVPDYRPRPTRGNSSGYRPSRTPGVAGNSTIPGRDSRGQSYTPGSNRTSNVGTTRPSSGSSMSRPSRGTSTSTPPPSSSESRPTRTQQYTPPPQSRPTYTPPPSTPSRSSGSSGSSSGSSRGGSSGGGRPSRGN